MASSTDPGPISRLLGFTPKTTGVRPDEVPPSGPKAATKLDKDIAQLTEVIMKAASGKPLKKSVSEEKAKQKQREQSVMFMLLDRIMNGSSEQKSEAGSE